MTGLTIERDEVLQATAPSTGNGQGAAIYVMRNADETKHLQHLVWPGPTRRSHV